MRTILFLLLMICGTSLMAQEVNQMDAQGKRHGIWKKTFEGTNVPRYEGQFDHGKEVGLFKFYKYIDKKGVLSATKEFEKDGSAYVKFYASNGKVISEGKMMGKEYIGKWLYYHKDGETLMIEENYNLKGHLEGTRKVFYPNGKLAEIQQYDNGKLHGISKMYAEEGGLLNEYTYVEGKLHGPSKSYDSDGQLRSEGNYRNNQQHGVWKFYENEKLIEEKDFTKKSKNPYKKQ